LLADVFSRLDKTPAYFRVQTRRWTDGQTGRRNDLCRHYTL